LPMQYINNNDLRERFTREARAVATLSHPNIVTIHEVGDFNNRPFFAMQHVEGQSLRDVIKSKELSPDQVISLAIQLCEGLSKAHQAGVIHRDIKPSNIVIDTDGRAKLLDFGLATVAGTDKLTKTGSTLGTVGYMSPEQASGRKIDERSDLFSLGVVLYEMITGRRPFRGEDEAATLLAVTQETPQPLARFCANVPDELQHIATKLLEKDAPLRYQTASGVISDLKRLAISGETTAISRETPRSRKLRRVFLSTSAAAIVILLALILKPWNISIQTTDEAEAVENRIVVMYFDNLTDVGDSLRLGEIISTVVITDLSNSDELQVVSSQQLNDILKQLGQEGIRRIDRAIASQVAAKARARWMLSGDILQTKPAVIVTAQLVEVGSGNIVASERLESGTDESVVSLANRLTMKIGEGLSLPLETPVAGATESAEAYRHYLEGIEFNNKYMFSEAESSFDTATELDSTFAMAYYWLSRTASEEELRRTAIAKAVRFIDKASEIEKQYIKARRSVFEGDTDEAIRQLESLVAEHPEEKLAYYILAWSYRNIRLDNKRAIELYEKVIEIDPLYKPAYNALAYVYDAVGNLDRSIWAINKYIELAPDEWNPYDTRGDLYWRYGKLDEAAQSFQTALDMSPGATRTLQKLADTYLFRQQYAEADSLYQILAVHPDKYERAIGRNCLINVLMYQGKYQQAFRFSDMMMKTDSLELGDSWSLVNKHWSRGTAYCLVLEDYESGRDEFEKMMAIEQRLVPEGDALSNANLAYAYAKLGDFRAVDALMEKNEEMFKSGSCTQWQLWFGRLLVEAAKENYDSAIAYYEILDTTFTMFQVSCLGGQMYLEAGRLADAVSTLENAVKRYDNLRAGSHFLVAVVHYDLGRAYEQTGWTDKAIEQYETFLDIWKNADEGLKSVDDAKTRLTRLKSKT